MSIENSFVSSARYPTPPTGMSASGRFNDKKNYISFSTDISLPLGNYKVSKFLVDIDKKDKSASSNTIHKPEDIVERLERGVTTNDNRNLHLRLIDISPYSGSEVPYNFINGNEYRILYEIYITHTAVNNAKTYYRLEHIHYFTYFETPVGLSNFTFNPNVQVGDQITVSGLLLVTGSAPDSTVPESTSDFEAVQFTFQEAEAQTGDTLNNQSTEPYIVDLPYEPSGTYTLPPNTLVNGKIYHVDVEKNWALGFSAHQRSSQLLYILDRPQIATAGVDVKDLSVHNDNDVVVSITMNNLVPEGAVAIPSTIWFEFTDSDDVLVARTASVTPSVDDDLYSFKLSDIDVVSNEEGILNGNQYNVKAVVQYPSGNSVPHERRSDAVSVTFDLTKPSISTISEYDAQNDGGEDGVPNGNDADSETQTIATVYINNAAYQLYAPSMIRFNFYNSSGNTLLARTSEYAFKNSLDVGTQFYDLQLNEITIVSGSALTNGTAYKVKAEVKLLDHDEIPNPEWRESATFTSIQFHQNVAPVPSVTISDTWDLATDSDPSSSPTRYDASPAIGVSGYFMKTAQFGPAYSKQLDITSTKFKIEYQVDNGSWVLATKAALSQKLSSESRSEAVSRVEGLSLVYRSDGLYPNVVGSGIGTHQEEMVFYISQYQGNNNAIAFTEDNNVKVRVTVVAAPGLWVSGESSSVPRVSNLLDLTKKIGTYDPSGDAEPWNSHDTREGLIHVDVNGAMITVDRSSLVAESSPIITYLPEGWKVVNTGNSSKVHLYYYANSVAAASQNSSNSFTVNDINGLGMCLVFDHHQGAREYPFIGLYTTPTASGNKASWYKSRIVYNNNNNSALGNTTLDATRAGLTLLYTGTDVPSFRPDIPSSRRVKLDINPTATLTFGNYGNEFVNLIALSTDSAASAGRFNFTLSEANLTTNSSVLSSLSMKFTKNLFLNIPVELESSSDSVKVGYKYNASHSYVYRTFNHPAQTVSLHVDPNQGTTIYYSIAYIRNNIQGLTFETSVRNKYFPVSSDYTVTNAAYTTFNDSPSKSSISFKLVLNADSRNQLGGVNVYFTSPETSTGSNINKIRIGTYIADFEDSVTLLNASGENLLVLDAVAQGTNLSWGDYDMANISFEAFRDARVISTNAPYKSTSSASDPLSSDFYVESGTQSTFGTPDRNPIWNVPVLTRPSADASGEEVYELSGGVINIADVSNHVITWPTANDANGLAFMYDIKFLKNGVVIGDEESYKNQIGNSYVIPIDTNNVAKYTIEVRKVFNGLLTNDRKLSQPDTIEFYSVKVETSGMNLSVQNPSTTSSVTLSWGAPAITGNSITASGSESAEFDDVIYSQYVEYRTTPDSDFLRLHASGALIEGPSPKLYTLPNTNLGTLYEFIMYIEAQVKYTLNDVVQEIKSVPHAVPSTPEEPTPQSQYIVSTIPSIVLPHSAPVLVQGSENPTLLLNLNAQGLEYEGFVSVVVILTQDGTPAKPDGEQALLIFPDPNGSHNPNNSPAFSFLNDITGISGNVANNPRLAGGESATSTPKNVTPSVLSTQNNEYTLRIGTAGSDGRYGLSTLRMPSSDNSGFQESGTVGSANYNPVNYMVILTTRRGTDIAVGDFTYQRTPVVSNVQIINQNGQYSVQFLLNPA